MPTQPAPPARPPYWREVIVTAPTILSLILTISYVIGPILRRIPDLAGTALTVTLVVMAFTWPVMPAVSRVLHNFLHPDEADTNR